MSKRTVSMNPYAQSQALKKEGGSGGGTAQSTTLAPIEGINATNLQDATAELYGDIVNVNRFAETVSESLADAYDDTATYEVGDYVTYSGSLYKCNTAIETPESFDENKWTHMLVSEITNDINEKLIYSTDETVCGMYKGKILYRKIVTVPVTSTWSRTLLNDIIPPVSDMFKEKVCFKTADGSTSSEYHNSENDCATVLTYSTTTDVGIYIRATNSSKITADITIEYTKAND